MTIDDIATERTHFRGARQCVRTEREATAARAAAFNTFRARVKEVSTQTLTPGHSVSPAGSASVQTTATARTATTGGCQAVRRAFAETVRPHSIEDIDESESVPETIAAEFTDEIATALTPDTEQRFTAELKRAVLTEVGTRREECKAVVWALDTEKAHLQDVSETVAEIADWVVATNETPLAELDFDDFSELHKTLATFRTRCQRTARERQEVVRTTRHTAGSARMRYRDCMEFAYRTRAVDHPVLATIASLDRVCAACQRSVRAHLTRRI